MCLNCCFVLQNLSIQENSPGKDGQGYMIRCTVECSSVPKKSGIPPLDIPFLFYNGECNASQVLLCIQRVYHCVS